MTTDVLPIVKVPNSTSAAAPASAHPATPRVNEIAGLADPSQTSEQLLPTFTAAAEPVQETLAAVAQQIESYLRSIGRSLEFQVDETSGETIVSVRNAETGELVRQIPGEETLRLARALGNQPNVLVDLIA